MNLQGRVLAGLLLLLLAGVPVARAQVGSSGVSGTVADESGGAVPGATVEIRNVDTGIRRELVTDERGHYVASSLPVGNYEVSVTMPGFSKVMRTGVRVSVGAETVVNVGLKVGGLEEAVDVEANVSAVDTTTASTGTLITTEQIEGLPLNGRSYIELASMTPGVQLTDVGGRSTSTGFGTKLSVHGSRYTANLFTLDGTMLNDQFNQAGSASGNVLGVEAVQEFRVLTNSFSAEYGRHTGAVINAATKSGTNAFRGSVFEFHRNDALDAPNYFDDPENVPDFVRNQYGFSLGGPIRKDRTFFFTAYEGLRENLGQTLIFQVPSDALRNSATVASSVRPFLQSYPQANGRALDANRGEYSRIGERTTREDYVMLRVDHQFGPSSRVFARYTFDDAAVENPSRVTTGERTDTRTQFLTVEHSYTRGSGFVNRFQLGWSRSELDGRDFVLPGITLPITSFTDIERGIGAMSITGLSPWGGSSTNPKIHEFRNLQLSDTIHSVQGRHQLKLGATVEFQAFDLTSDFTSMGNYTFNTLNAFLAGTPSTFEAILPGSDASRRLRQKVFGFFVQDDFRVSDRLTINAGVRYEPTSSVTETEGRLAQLIDFTNPRATLNDTTVVDELFENPSLRTIAPRVGVVWNPDGTGKTAIRAGAGVFYDLVTLSQPFVQNTAVRVPPFINRGGLQSPTVIAFPTAYNANRAQLAGQAALEGIQYDLDQPVMYKWNANIQRELGARITAELGYTGSHGRNLVRMVFTNGREAVVDANGRLFVAASTPLRQPGFQRMRYRLSDATSDYHGLTAGLTRRTADLSLQLSYTWSKAIDEGASALGSGDFEQEGGGSRYLDMKDRGLSPFDTRHSFVGSASYDLPFGREADGVLARVMRDWNVGGLVRFRTGYPFSVFTGVDRGRQQFAPRYPDLCPGASSNNPTDGGTAEQWFDPTAFCLPAEGVIGNLGRNTLVGPDLFTVDLVLSRRFALGGARALELRVEGFNVTNRVNLAPPSGQALNLFAANGAYLAGAGRITSTATSARQVQLGARFVF